MNKTQLRESADKIIGNYNYFRPLSEDERSEKKDLISESMIRLNELQEELAEYRKEIKESTKPLSDQLRTLLKEIKLNGMEVTEEVYVHFNHDEDKAIYFNAEGEQIYTRRLLPDEKQITVFKAINE